jgi:hypothetical protein
MGTNSRNGFHTLPKTPHVSFMTMAAEQILSVENSRSCPRLSLGWISSRTPYEEISSLEWTFLGSQFEYWTSTRKDWPYSHVDKMLWPDNHTTAQLVEETCNHLTIRKSSDLSSGRATVAWRNCNPWQPTGMLLFSCILVLLPWHLLLRSMAFCKLLNVRKKADQW